MDKIHIRCIVKINAGAHCLTNEHRPVRGISDNCVTGHSTDRLKNGIVQRYLRSAYAIKAKYLKSRCLRPVSVGCRLSLKGGLSCIYAMGNVLDIRIHASRGALYGQSASSEISTAVAGILHTVQVLAEE